MKIGMVMVNYNDASNVEKMLHMLEKYPMIDKIVIVDNASTDDSLEKMKTFESDRVVILESDHNGGYGAGINIGAKYLNALYDDCYIIISNTDIILYGEKDLKELIATFDEETAVVGPVIREHEGYNTGWKIPTPWQDILLSLPYIYHHFEKKNKYSREQIGKNIKEVEAVSGSFFIIRGSDLDEVGYFDEKLFLYYEENVLSKKLQNIHKKVKINGKVEIFHNHSVTINKVHTSVQKYKNLKRSQYYFQTEYNRAGIVNRFVMKVLFGFVTLGLKIRNFKHKNV